MKLKRWHWVLIILATVVLVVMAPSDDGAAIKKNARPEKMASSASAPTPDRQTTHPSGRVQMELLSRLKMKLQESSSVNNVFNNTSWYVSPPAPPPSVRVDTVAPPPPPPPAPTAPPQPFTYLGRYGDSPSRIVILSKGERVYTATVGDVIDNTYRVEKFTTGMVNLTYLPLNILQSLPTGDAL